MSYYISRLKIRDGEREYYSRSVFTATNLSVAQKHADYLAETFWDGGYKESPGDEGYMHCHGETYVKVDDVTSISKEDYDVLRKYL